MIHTRNLILLSTFLVLISCEIIPKEIIPNFTDDGCRVDRYVRYDRGGNILEERSFSYDTTDRLINIKDLITPGEKEFKYNENGQVKEIWITHSRLGYYLASTYEYDESGRISRLNDKVYTYKSDTIEIIKEGIIKRYTGVDSRGLPSAYSEWEQGIGITVREDYSFDENANLVEWKIWGWVRPDTKITNYEYNLDYPYLMPGATPGLFVKRHNAISGLTSGRPIPYDIESFVYEKGEESIKVYLTSESYGSQSPAYLYEEYFYECK